MTVGEIPIFGINSLRKIRMRSEEAHYWRVFEHQFLAEFLL